MLEIHEELIQRITIEREQEYEAGYVMGIKLARKYDYPTIERIKKAMKHQDVDTLVVIIGDTTTYEILSHSEEYQKGIIDAIDALLTQSSG